jgi:hypothetical protein
VEVEAIGGKRVNVLRERAGEARALALAAGVHAGTLLFAAFKNGVVAQAEGAILIGDADVVNGLLDFGGEALVLGMEHLEAPGEEDPEGAAASLRPLEAPRTAQLRLIEAEADATCEHRRKRAGEAVLVLGLNLGAGEHLLR